MRSYEIIAAVLILIAVIIAVAQAEDTAVCIKPKKKPYIIPYKAEDGHVHIIELKGKVRKICFRSTRFVSGGE